MGLIPRRLDRAELKEWQPRLWLILIGLLLLAAYVIAFIVKNDDEVTLDFVFVDAHVSLIWLILLSLGIGFVGGLLLSQLSRRRARRQSGGGGFPQRPPPERGDELSEPRGVDVPRSSRAEREPR